jgi:hypothetical protein
MPDGHGLHGTITNGDGTFAAVEPELCKSENWGYPN